MKNVYTYPKHVILHEKYFLFRQGSYDDESVKVINLELVVLYQYNYINNHSHNKH